MTTMSTSAARRVRRRLARCGWRARATSSPTATLCTFGLRRKGQPHHMTPRARGADLLESEPSEHVDKAHEAIARRTGVDWIGFYDPGTALARVCDSRFQ